MRKRILLFVMTLLALASCGSDDDISRTFQVVIPAGFATIPQGTLYLTLWSVDPDILDATPTLLDRDDTSFQHNTGQVTTVFLHVSGKPHGGWRHYMTVEGCVPGTGGGSTEVFYAYVSSTQQTMAVVQPQTTPIPCSNH